jgi:hypothetical protein
MDGGCLFCERWGWVALTVIAAETVAIHALADAAALRIGRRNAFLYRVLASLAE